LVLKTIRRDSSGLARKMKDKRRANFIFSGAPWWCPAPRPCPVLTTRRRGNPREMQFVSGKRRACPTIWCVNSIVGCTPRFSKLAQSEHGTTMAGSGRPPMKAAVRPNSSAWKEPTDRRWSKFFAGCEAAPLDQSLRLQPSSEIAKIYASPRISSRH
jgi:hypothetical protein